MWCQVLIVLAVAMPSAQANNSFFKNFGVFDIEPGHALDGHVIKSLPLFKADCMETCKETLSCFSINTYKDQHGNNLCDLNRSTKKQSPKSYSKRVGYDYSEPLKGEFCLKDDCPTKEALPDNWYKFNSSSYKYFINTTNWDGARKHCQELGGDLASFSSETENEFVFKTMLHDLNITNESNTSGLYPHLKFNGTDAGLSLIGAAQFETKDSKPAVSFNGTSYAEIPRFDLHSTDFTIAVHVFPRTASSAEQILLEGFTGSSSIFEIGIDSMNSSGISIATTNSVIKVYYKGIPNQKWTHIAFTWNYKTGVVVPHINGQRSSSTASTSPSPKSFRAMDPFYQIGKGLDGWMSNMVVVPRILTSQEIKDLFNGAISNITDTQPSILQGAWVGLNDKATEGIIQWSDGLPLTYKPNEELGNSEKKDCGLFIKINGDESAWKTEICQANATYVCKKNH
ncbi:uncharacterized protein LOC116289037 [Actinia tenebrosa]|uniref:Uncharacterized protein LOC116289037 n=1 Tax=Actinia tenebrosa TaxID=6105 RepID=A0A6P8HGU6_ACTTE|nr:uncharacterized protein LOC116289037 [Actinia tenebrosa]XP_031551774.1 uncharacterized protein LOC116289037 [Actinia tenebrosa]XP_031551775.1 uncharacterized protein LOC116289037 [Actinia tenebrosa]